MMQDELAARLAEPFEATEVKWKAQVVRGNRALSVAYVDARLVEDRLDQVFGVDGWQDAYQVLPNNNVICKLRVRIGQDWIEKSDVGGQSDQPDEGDRMKSAFSDALKRAAVKLGIGRYLYRLPQQWVDYDHQSRQITQTPKLPAWAYPRKSKQAAKAENGRAMITREQWEQIKLQLLQNHVSQRKFLEHFQVQKPGELPAERFTDALQLAQQVNPLAG
jgi:hypothetical protein